MAVAANQHSVWKVGIECAHGGVVPSRLFAWLTDKLKQTRAGLGKGSLFMYEAHFGLKHRPFRATPDPMVYYPATPHETALAVLTQAIEADEGLMVLTGNPGTGKTLVSLRLLEHFGNRVTTAFLTNSHIPNRAGLLQALLFDWSLPYEGRSEQELRLAATDLLLENVASRRRTVVVVDEAQHLYPDLLEELRLLNNLEAGAGKAFQVVLIGQTLLLDNLRAPELEVLRQRLAVRIQLEPLGWHEAADYLIHHLRQAGARAESLFSDEALELLARGAKGVPRLLNQAAHLALTLAYQSDATEVDAEAALEALAFLELDPDAPGPIAETSENVAEQGAGPRPFAPNRKPA
jgi:type II secretory pathway predicted ATPase ExeA